MKKRLAKLLARGLSEVTEKVSEHQGQEGQERPCKICMKPLVDTPSGMLAHAEELHPDHPATKKLRQLAKMMNKNATVANIIGWK